MEKTADIGIPSIVFDDRRETVQRGVTAIHRTPGHLNLDEDINEDSVYDALEQVWNHHIDPLLREYLRGKSEAELYKILLKLRNCYYYDNEDDYDKEY